MQPSDLLLGAKILIDSPDKWLQKIQKNSDNTAFCSFGALKQINTFLWDEDPKSNTVSYCYLIKAVKKIAGSNMSLMCYNDHHTHTEVMQVWDLAIELAKLDE